ncbi:MAG: PIG-L deacetylase family protein [Promethearchaeota archaeon]
MDSNIMQNKYIKVQNGIIPLVIPESMIIFAAHPDDELLSAGGTILKYSKLGTKISVVVATKGYGGYATNNYKDKIAETRKKELETVSSMLNCKFIELNWNEVAINRENVALITNLIRDLKPQVILSPHPIDTHRNHRNFAYIIKEAIYHTSTGKAYGGAGREFIPYAVYFYESPSCKFKYVKNSIFITVDISDYWESKKEIFVKAYTSQAEMMDRIILWAEKTARLRGNENLCEYGESFIPYTEYTPLKILLQ